MSTTTPNIPPLTSDEPNDPLFDTVIAIVAKYYPQLVPAVCAALAVIASLALKYRTLPLSLIYEGPSGFGKTAIIQMVLDDKLSKYIYRSDNFTPKSFVSHAANVKRKDLDGIDLLPRLEKKTLVTKELAPLFRGRMEELQQTFSQLCTVLDGKGLTTDSGMQGRRGYKRYIVFNWLGATTPVPVETHRLMYQLGTRLLFYEIVPIQLTTNQLFQYLKKDQASEAEEQTRKAIKLLLLDFFSEHPVETVEPTDIAMADELLMEVARWAGLIAAGRAELKREMSGGGLASAASSKAVAANPPEAPYKIGTYLSQLARGHALIHGRSMVTTADLELVGHVAISSIPGYFRPIVRQLREQRVVDSTAAARLCNVTAPTARKYLEELALLGFGAFNNGNRASEGQEEAPATLTRAAAYDWLQITQPVKLGLVQRAKP